MQVITDTTPDMVDATKQGKTQINNHSSELQSKCIKQTSNNKSITKQIDDNLESKLFKTLGSVFLFIIIYIISCETTRYGFRKFGNLPKNDFLCICQILCCILIILLSLVVTISVIFFIVSLFFSVTGNFVPSCVKYIYIDGKKSYNWWETESFIYFVVISIVMILWAIFFIELSDFVLTNWDLKNIGKDRFIVYRISGIIILLLCSFSGFIHLIDIEELSDSTKNKPVKAK